MACVRTLVSVPRDTLGTIVVVQQNDNKNIRILELGAGLGLVGIVASHVAVSEKLYSMLDGWRHECLAPSCAKMSSKISPSSKTNTSVSCHQLLWGHDTATSFRETHGGRFDLILASDILYASCVIEPLWETVRALLEKPDGVFVMAFATRKVKVTIDDFIQAAKEDFVHKCVDWNKEEGVFVYEFTWKEHKCSVVCSLYSLV